MWSAACCYAWIPMSEYMNLQFSHCRFLCPLRWYIRHYIFLPIGIPPCYYLLFDTYFLICTSALESSSFILFRFSCPVSLLYHIGFLKIDLKMVNANDSKFTQITLSLPKCSYKQRNLNVYSWSCHRIFVPEQFVNTYVILYYFVF